ncbi:MAG: hypothetical protein ABJB34_00225 [Acidobacteriota bacterium]
MKYRYMSRVFSVRRSIAAFFILLVSLMLFGCEPPAKRDAARLAGDQSSMTELKRIEALLATKRPVTRLEMDSLQRLREQYPSSDLIRRLLVAAFIKREDWVAVERVISEIPEVDKTSADKLTLAKVYFKEGRFDDAAILLKAIPPGTPESTEAIALLGSAQFYSGDIDAAKATLESIQPNLISQKRGDELAILGTIYFRHGENQHAIDVLQKAAEISPDNISANSVLSRVYAATGDEPKAAAFRARLDAINEKVASEEKRRSRTAGLFYQLEDAYAAHDYDNVIGLVERIQPDADVNTKATLYQYLAAVYKAQGKEREATQALADAARLTQK